MTPEEYYSEVNCPFCNQSLYVGAFQKSSGYYMSCRSENCGSDYAISNGRDIAIQLGKYYIEIDLKAGMTYVDEEIENYHEHFIERIVIFTKENYLEEIEKIKRLQLFR